MHHPHRDPEEAVDPAHPLGVQGGEVVVDRDQMRALAGQGVEIERQGGHQRLALAGLLHLGDAAFVEHHAADHLDVEVALADGPLGRLADHREGLVHQIVQALPGREPGLELVRLGPQRLVGERRHLRLQDVDPGHPAKHRLDLPVIGGAENLLQIEHENAGVRLWPSGSRRGGDLGSPPNGVNARGTLSARPRACGRRRWRIPLCPDGRHGRSAELASTRRGERRWHVLAVFGGLLACPGHVTGVWKACGGHLDGMRRAAFGGRGACPGHAMA